MHINLFLEKPYLLIKIGLYLSYFQRRKMLYGTIKKKHRESDLTKIVISRCRGNLKLRVVGKEEKPVLKC